MSSATSTSAAGKRWSGLTMRQNLSAGKGMAA